MHYVVFQKIAYNLRCGTSPKSVPDRQVSHTVGESPAGSRILFARFGGDAAMMIRDPEQGVERSGKMAAARPAAVIRGSGRHTGPERPRSGAERYRGSRSSYFLNGHVCQREMRAGNDNSHKAGGAFGKGVVPV